MHGGGAAWHGGGHGGGWNGGHGHGGYWHGGHGYGGYYPYYSLAFWGWPYYGYWGYPYYYGSYPAYYYPNAPVEGYPQSYPQGEFGPAPDTTQVQPNAPGAPTQGPTYMNYCESARAYYPKVASCPEGWKFIPSR